MDKTFFILCTIIFISCNTNSTKGGQINSDTLETTLDTSVSEKIKTETEVKKVEKEKPQSEIPYTKLTQKSNIEILTFEKAIDSSSSGLTSEEAVIACKDWILDKKKIKTILTTSVEIDGSEWHYFYDILPCKYSGEFLMDGKKGYYYINSGASGCISFKDTGVRIGYKGNDYQKYFMEGRAVFNE